MEEPEFLLQEKLVRLRLLDNVSGLKVAGLLIEGSKGQEIEVPLWIAEELTKINKGEVVGEGFELKDLAKAHWREALPSSRHLSKIEETFYFKLRRFLRKMRVEGEGNIEKAKALEKAYSMARDIINCRMRKIASIAASQVEREEVAKNLALEERFLYESLKEIINDWSKRVLEDVTFGESAGEPRGEV